MPKSNNNPLEITQFLPFLAEIDQKKGQNLAMYVFCLEHVIWPLKRQSADTLTALQDLTASIISISEKIKL